MDPIRIPLKTDRGMLKTVLLGIITLGIYPIVVYTRMGRDMNTLSYRDGKKTMNFCLMLFVFFPLTLTVAGYVWIHRLSNRMGVELARRGLPYRFSAGTFWGKHIFSILLVLAAVLGAIYALYLQLPLPQLNLYWGAGLLVFVLLVAIGPWVFLHKLCTAMNMLCSDYNLRG